MAMCASQGRTVAAVVEVVAVEVVCKVMFAKWPVAVKVIVCRMASSRSSVQRKTASFPQFIPSMLPLVTESTTAHKQKHNNTCS